MTADKKTISVQEAGTLLLFSAGIFVLDVLAPISVSAWLLYFLPLALTFLLPHRRAAFYYSALITLFMFAAYAVHPVVGLPRSSDLLNRVIGLTAIWTLAFVAARFPKSRLAAERSKPEVPSGRRRAEEESLAGRLRLESIVQSAMDAILTIDEDQSIVLFNEAAEAMFECRAQEAIGGPLDRFIPARFRAAHRDHIVAFGESGTTSRRMGVLGQVRALTARGEEFPVEAAISQISVDGKKYFTVILRDLRERERLKRAEAELRHSEERLRKAQERFEDIFESSKDAIGYLSLGGAFVLANDAFARLTGYSRDELLSKTHRDLTPPEFNAMQAQEAAHVLQTGEPAEYEREYVRKDGSRVPVAVTLFLVKGDDGKPDGVAVIVRDIAQRKRLQEQLRRTERVAELGTLASGMAHEIGTPMNVILGRAEYLMNRTTDEPIKKGLQTIVSQVERITRVMNQLLSFARRRTMERRAVDLKEVVESSLEMFHERLPRHHIIVEIDVEEGCPPVHADADQMSQVLINLLMNAVHAMPDGGRIGITIRRGGPDMVEWIIADTGSGIPPDVLAKVFDPFFTTKEFGAGTGLGLTVVKGIMEEHGGSISVESEPGKGTTFKMVVPQSDGGAGSL